MAMDIPAECRTIEARVKAAGGRVDEMCRLAEINRATWQRWKSGDREPLIGGWNRVHAVVAEFEREHADKADAA